MASKYVISAAHCFMETAGEGSPRPDMIVRPPKEPADVIIFIGDHNLYERGETTLPEKQVDVVKLTHHPNYVTTIGESAAQPWDLTVVELAEAVNIGTYTPACMAKSTDATTFDGKQDRKVYRCGILRP